MTDNTRDHSHADQRSVLRPWALAVVMVAAGLALLFWDNDPGNSSPSFFTVFSRVH